MTAGTVLELNELFAHWKMSQAVLRQTLAVLDDAPAGKVKAGLENALMRRILDEAQTTPLALFSSVTPETLVYGLDVMGIQLSDKDAASIHAMIQKEIAAVQTVEVKHSYIADKSLSVGEFVLPMIAPVKRLYAHALTKMSEEVAQRAVLASALQYDALYAETRHIGPPQCVYDMFHAWGVRNEGFASPFNARLLTKPESRFFSAFPHTDAPFGSQGSFFKGHWKNCPGAWSVDPPFLPETLGKTDAMIAAWRAEGCPPILLIGPSSYRPKTPFDEEVTLLKDTHFYEGLDGDLHMLPVDVSIWRFGDLPGFDAQAIKDGYLPKNK